MSNLYRASRWEEPGGYFAACRECARLEEENHDLRIQVAALKVTLDLLTKVVLADFEWRGFPDAEEYLNELVIKEVKREADYGSEWPC